MSRLACLESGGGLSCVGPYQRPLLQTPQVEPGRSWIVLDAMGALGLEEVVMLYYNG